MRDDLGMKFLRASVQVWGTSSFMSRVNIMAQTV